MEALPLSDSGVPASTNSATACQIAVAWSHSGGQAFERPLPVPPGSTVAVALDCAHQAAVQQAWPHWPTQQEVQVLAAGVWGRVCAPERVLQSGDRLELYRPLRVDPKTARRERFRKQGARAAGLFDRRRPPPTDLS